MSDLEIHLRVEELYVEVNSSNQASAPMQGRGLVAASREVAETLGGLNELSFQLDVGSEAEGTLSVVEEPAVMKLAMGKKERDMAISIAGMSNGSLVITAELIADKMGTFRVPSFRIRRRFG